MAEAFEYDNLIGRPSGPFLRIGAKLHKGISAVQEQVSPYAAEWLVANQSEMASDKPLWVVLGDSMAQGIGASRYDHGWPGYLREALLAAGQDYKLVNLSISGARVADVLERQLPAMHALGEKPALVTMMIGSNDLVRKAYRQKAPAEYAELLSQMPAGSVIANLPGYGAMQQAIDAQLDVRARAGTVRLVDMRRNGPSGWHGKLATDHFHPNDAGYKAIGAVFAGAMGL